MRLFWLNDLQWAAIKPHLPMVHTGPRRVDDRRVISGNVYRLRNVIARTFCRIKDFRGIATRYDTTARNFLAAVGRVSAIAYRA